MNIRQAISGKDRVRVAAMLDGPQERAALRALAASENWRLQFVNSRPSLIEELKRYPAVVLCDGEWRAVLEDLRAERSRSRTILVSPKIVDKLWLEVLGLGGYDVVTSPFHEHRLIDAIAHAWAELTK